VGLAEEGFESLFNGKDLTGWDGNPELWSVEDGVITGKTKGAGQLQYNQFLVWTGGKVANFELRVEFRMEGDNNSGVQYRSQRRPELGDWVVAGYQADIHPNPPYTAMLYDERGRGIIAQRGQRVVVNKDGKKDVSALEAPVEPVNLTQWHELTITAQGSKLTHKIDGITAVEVVDEQEGQRDVEGVLAFQVHVGPAMKAQFRNVRLKQLAEAKPAPTSQNDRDAKDLPKWVWLQEEVKKEPKKKKPEEPKPEAKVESQPAASPAEKPAAAPPEAKVADSQPQPPEPEAKEYKPAARLYLRKEVKVTGPITAAHVYTAADDKYTLYINGKEAVEQSGFKSVSHLDAGVLFPHSAEERTIVFALDATNSGGAGGALVQIDLENQGRRVQTIVTDDSWTCSLKSASGWQQAGFQNADWKPVEIVKQLGEEPWNLTEDDLLKARRLKTPDATPVDRLVVKKDFKVELLYSVPKLLEGSWVSMCTDPKGRLIVCDQYGGLLRVTPPGIQGAKELRIEPINVDIGEAQGLLWAFESLYVVVNKGAKYESGVYRVRDTNNDDQLDAVETLRLLPGSGGEHGPHAAVLAPDGKSIYIVCGNKTNLTDFAVSRVPKFWDEDGMLPRIYGKGFMKETPAPGGYISRIDPDGKNWELVSVGFRNEYDAAFNADGELFAYDADMEWDLNTPWYRPTRVCQVLSGVDYGWRNGSGKFPEHYMDTVPPVVNIGPGSPTGVCFGYQAKFPEKYQKALFLCDWSYGKLYAAHLETRGCSYSATFEEFITGTPLPLTDIVINPVDRAMYFAIGGRKVQSGLYRVTYTGPESTAAVDARSKSGEADRKQLRELEALHLGDHPEAVEIAWSYLNSGDRVLRSAARTAIEHRPVEEWAGKALNESKPTAKLEALLALCRTQERKTKDPKLAVDTAPPVWDDAAPEVEGPRGILQVGILTSLGEMDWTQFGYAERLAGTRVLQLALLRLGQPGPQVRDALLSRIGEGLPAGGPELNAMLLDVLVYLQSPEAARQGLALLETAPSQEEQMMYAKALGYLRAGWTPELQERFFQWFVKAGGYRGGVGFDLFVKDIREHALEGLTDEQKTALKPILEMKPPEQVNTLASAPRPFVKEWKMEELLPLLKSDLKDRDFDHGRKLFGAANCFACHRFGGEGGALGPDLTSLAGRFDARAILESVLEPSKVISDQYAAVHIVTLDGKVIIGRIMNLHKDNFSVNTNMLDPNAVESVDRREIEEMGPAKTSMMPQGLLNTLNREEVLDLMAFLLSRGDRNNPMFKGAGAKTQAAR
jgi:putative heme-binding domain-containing protein